MNKLYIWEHSGWPYLAWDNKELSPLLGEIRNKQGVLVGKISLLGDDLKKRTLHQTVVSEIMASARIEGKRLDEEFVMIKTGQYLSQKRFQLKETDDLSIGASQVFIDALYNYNQTITAERLFLWKYALEGETGYDRLTMGWFEADSVLNIAVQKPVERKMEYMKIPVPPDTACEMKTFLTWLNTVHPTDPVIKAAVAYLRFLLIRPFEQNNGRIARNIAAVFLLRADNRPELFYSLSAQIENDRNQYNEILVHTQTGSTDITEWLRWFLYCLGDALTNAEADLLQVLNKSKFFDRYRLLSLNDRQLHTLNLLWDGFDGKLTTTVYGSVNKCSQDTALRDIQDMISKDILRKEHAGGRSTAYCLNDKSYN
jgi:Fic family protein